MDTRGFLPGGKSAEVREADHSPSSSAEVKNAWSYAFNHSIQLHSVVLGYKQGQLYLCLTFAFEGL